MANTWPVSCRNGEKSRAIPKFISNIISNILHRTVLFTAFYFYSLSARY